MASRQSSFRLFAALSIALAAAAGAAIPAHAQIAWTNYTTGSGLGNNFVSGVYASGSTIYAATDGGGLSVSANNGTSWTNYTNGSGLGSNYVYGVYAAGSTIYAATSAGLSVSANNGTSWINYTSGSGLGNSAVNGVYASGSKIYAATYGGGLSVGIVPPDSVALDATSGTGTISTNYTTTTIGTGGLTLSNGFFAEYLAVGGGGSGGTAGAVSSNQNNWGTGGGGAGGMLSGTMQLSATNYAVTVGGGGAAPAYVSGTTSQGNNGGDSVFGSVTAVGGGGGGGGENSFGGVGASGGSGGGGGSKYLNAGGAGTADQGNAGGAARAGDQSDAGNRTAGGGGGGAGAVGSPGVSTVAGNGGVGLASTITGTSVTYAGGGGGGAGDTNQTPTAGSGGAGGGGAGGANTGIASNGTDGLGGGGGGRGADGVGGRGGSGVVIVRYAGASLGSIGGTVTSGSGSAAGSTLHTFTTSGTTSGTNALNLSGVDMNARLGVTLTGTISGTGSLTFAGPGRLTLAEQNTFTGDTRISSGTLAIGNANALQNSTLDMNASDSGAITFSQASNIGGFQGSRNVANGGNTLAIGGNNLSTTYSGQLSGSGGLSKQGTGTLTLAGVNTFTGDTRIASGTLAVSNPNALEFSTLDMNASDSGAISFVPFSLLGGLTGSRNLDNGGHYLQIGRNNQSTSYSGVLSGTGGLIKRGTGTLTLSGSNSFVGQAYVQTGTLVIANANALAVSELYVDDFSKAISFTQNSSLGGLSGDGGNVNNGGFTLTIGGNNASTTYSGTVFGTGGLTKNGTGTLTLSGNNSFTGGTRVASGTLAIGTPSALVAASDLTVDSGATLDRAGYSQTVAAAVLNGTVGNTGGGGLLTVTGTLSGSGLVNGDVTVNGVHAPGNSPGIQTFNGDLSYGSSAVVNWELIANTASNSPVVFDQIVLNGLADLTFSGSNVLALSFAGAGSLVNWTDSFWDVNRAWTVFDLASGVTTGFGNLSLGGSLLDANSLALDAGTRGSFSLAQSGQDVVLQFTAVAVPEPSTWLMGLAGVACGGYSFRRRKRA